MRVRRRLRQLGPHLRRLNVGLAALAYVVAAVGFPAPARPLKDPTSPFPCQGRACGCRTADQCRQRCCCFTPDQHRAWARAHHVRPPPEARGQAEEGWNTVPLRLQAAGGAACCAKAEARNCASCARHERQATTAKPATTAPGPRQPVAEHKPTPPRAAGTVWVIGSLRQQCHGLSTLWVTAGAALSPPSPVLYAYDWHPAGWLRPATEKAPS
jgi:hypothetical protein